MTSAQKYAACVALAPNFRIGIEYTTLPIVSRALVWHGRRPADMNELSSGMSFPEGHAFEPLLGEVLTRALATLQGALYGPRSPGGYPYPGAASRGAFIARSGAVVGSGA